MDMGMKSPQIGHYIFKLPENFSNPSSERPHLLRFKHARAVKAVHERKT
jgi:hypothetical protein